MIKSDFRKPLEGKATPEPENVVGERAVSVLLLAKGSLGTKEGAREKERT